MSARILKNHRGSTLILVILVFALLIILATAALAVAEGSHVSSVNDWQNQQAYFTSRSAVLAAADYFKQHPELNIEDYVGIPGASNTTDGMGSYKVTITKLDEKRFQISSTADFQGRTRTVRAIVAKADNTFPFGQNLVTATKFNGKASALAGGAVIHGNLMINDTIALPQGVEVYGDLYIDGPVSITGGPKVKKETNGKGGNIYSTGDITLNSVSVAVDGNFYSAGNLYGSGGGIDMTSNSSVMLIGGNIGGSGFTISNPNNIVAWKNSDFQNCTVKTRSGKLYLGGTQKIYQYDNSYKYVSVVPNYSPASGGFVMPDLSYADSIDNLKGLIDYTAYNQFVDSFKTNVMNINGNWGSTYTLNQSGTLKNVVNFNQTLIVDTAAGDIHLYVDKSVLNNGVFSQFSTKVIGPNQLIIHLAQDVTDFNYSSYTSLAITGSQTAVTSATVPKVCIVAPYAQNNITLSGSTKTAAYIIMPYGNFSVSGGSLFVGNAIVGSSQLTSGAQLYYQTPNYPSIPGIGKIEVASNPLDPTNGGVSLVGVYTNQ